MAPTDARLMTTAAGPTENLFVTRRLPWLIAAVGFGVYLLSLNHWISLASLGTVARLSGWLAQLGLGRPLSLVVFGPLKLFPSSWLPLLANLLTAGVAALVLGQLARSVALLRHDVAPAGPLRKTGPGLLTGRGAWLPPVFAALGLGLHLGFWENATSASGEMVSLLCFAVAFRCVLEFRLEPQDRWLFRGALAYALGMTEDALMVGYLPAFVAGVIWVKGYGNCLTGRFFVRMLGAALLGLSLYLLVPLLLCASAPEQWDLWPALRAQWGAQKQALQIFRGPALRLLVVSALLPFVLLAVRWRSHTVQLADDTHVGVFFSKNTGHFIHALFFLAALWMAFTPTLTSSPVELTAPLLPYQYTWALVAGHCAGYLLLFGQTASKRRPVKWPAVALGGLLGLLPAALLWKNLGELHLTNGSALREFARQLADDLPAGPVTVLSDESRPLLLLRAELTARGRERDPMLVDTRALAWPEYHRRMAADYGGRWPAVPPTNRMEQIAPVRLRELVRQIATNEPVVYLHPSSGFFYEDFAAIPHGWIQRLQPRTTPSPAMPDQARANDEFWQTRWTNQLASRAVQFANSRERAARWARAPGKSLKLASRENATALPLAGAYSKVLNVCGVQAQQAGLTAAAREWFERALAFDPDNLAAHLNLEFATRQQHGDPNRLTQEWARATFPKLVARYSRWADVISYSGPVDDPTFLLHTGRMYLAAGQPQQALEAFVRSAALAPDWADPRLWQAETLNWLGDFAAALALTESGPVTAGPLPEENLAQLLQIRVIALHRTGHPNDAAAYLEQITTAHQTNTNLVATAADLCARTGQFRAEVKWREVLLQRDPGRVDWLGQKGRAELRAGESAAAIATLSQALTLSPADDQLRLFRAVAALEAGQLQDARRDYEVLLQNPAQAPHALFGLGDIAWRKGDTNAMIQYYQAFLTNSAVPSRQMALVTQRMQQAWRE